MWAWLPRCCTSQHSPACSPFGLRDALRDTRRGTSVAPKRGLPRTWRPAGRDVARQSHADCAGRCARAPRMREIAVARGDASRIEKILLIRSKILAAKPLAEVTALESEKILLIRSKILAAERSASGGSVGACRATRRTILESRRYF